MSDEERVPILFDSPPTYGEVVAPSYSEAVALKPIKPEVISEQPNLRLGQHPSESVINMIYSEDNSPNDQTIIIDRYNDCDKDTPEDCCDICCKNGETLLYCCLCFFEMLRCVAEIAK